VIQRDDETEAAILHRRDTYNEKTAPLVDFYRKEGILRDFVSVSSAETVQAIKKELAQK
jgi:adenylate kinase